MIRTMRFSQQCLSAYVVILIATVVFLPADSATVTYLTNNLTCYDCSELFKNYWDPFTPCQANLTAIPLIRCHQQDRYCRVERTTVKGMTISISRGCAEECIYGCRAYGYGITQLRCTSCCRGYGCNTDNAASSLTCTLTICVTMLLTVVNLLR